VTEKEVSAERKQVNEQICEEAVKTSVQRIASSGSDSVESELDRPSSGRDRVVSQAKVMDSLNSGLTRPDSGI